MKNNKISYLLLLLVCQSMRAMENPNPEKEVKSEYNLQGLDFADEIILSAAIQKLEYLKNNKNSIIQNYINKAGITLKEATNLYDNNLTEAQGYLDEVVTAIKKGLGY